jgi:hypothetical protein
VQQELACFKKLLLVVDSCEDPLKWWKAHEVQLSHPYFGQVWGWSPTLGKSWDLESSGTPASLELDSKGQNTSHWGVFVSLKRSWNVDIENGLELVIWTSPAQVMGKRRAGSQTGSQTTTKSRESTCSRCPIQECDMTLKRSRQGLQLWFRPRRNLTLQPGVMAVQSFRSPVGTISGLHFGSPENLCHLDAASVASCREYYRE